MGAWPKDLEFGEPVLIILRAFVSTANEHVLNTEDGLTLYPDSEELVSVVRVRE